METNTRTITPSDALSGAWIDRVARRWVLRALRGIEQGALSVAWPGGAEHIAGTAGVSAAIEVHHPRFFTRALLGGEIGLGESYMDGDWSSPELVRLIGLMLDNRAALEQLPPVLSWPSRVRDQLAHWRRRNSKAGSRRNITEHYDLSNEFFALFLDDSMMYSCAVFDRGDEPLESAQQRKLRSICEQLELRPGDHVLEIGSGWGGFAVFAAKHYGCRITTTTISAAQHAGAAERIRAAGLGDRIELRRDDYRDLRGRFDKIVSIEMFEAVGLDHYDTFFAACDRLLSPSGSMLLQTITVDDWRFDDYRRTPSWIAKYIFPGSELASVSRMLASLARVSTLGLTSITQIGPHYALTLRQWRHRFMARRSEVRALGFDDRFIRMWELYLAYCEAAFAWHHIGNAQLVLMKPAARVASFERTACAQE